MWFFFSLLWSCVPGYFRESQTGWANMENRICHFCKSRITLVWCWSDPGQTIKKCHLKRQRQVTQVTQAGADLCFPNCLLTRLIQEDAVVSRSTEARHTQSRGKGTLEISAVLLCSAPCDPATDQPPAACIVPCPAAHCSLAMGDGAHSMGW